MRKFTLIILLSLVSRMGIAQDFFKRHFPKSAVTGQFAGSIGFWSIGYSRLIPSEKVELGILYGKVPVKFGGVVRSVTFKMTYNPFKVYILPKLRFEPVQAGLFLCQSFGSNLGLSWPDKYPQGYYWWPRSLREHVFLSTQLSWMINKKRIDRVAAYLETNTNDLYMYSYFSNTKSLRLIDMFFLGCGLKLYFH